MPKVIIGALLALAAWAFLEQWMLRRRPWWLARVAWLPGGSRDIPADAADAEWPAPFDDPRAIVTPPSDARVGYVVTRTLDKNRHGGVARLAREGGTIRASMFPAFLISPLGAAIVFVAMIGALSDWPVTLVLGAIIFVMFLYPSWSGLKKAKARLEVALDLIVEKMTRPEPAPVKKKRGGSGGRRRKPRRPRRKGR